MDPLLSFHNIRKQFGSSVVLHDVSFSIQENEVFGLLGANGAGKTTFIRALLKLLHADGGEVRLQGKVLRSTDIQNVFGFLPENFYPPRNLRACEFLNIIRRGISGSPRDVDRLLEMVGLAPHKDKYIRAFSRGMIQRLGLACSLLKDPQVIILDEPTLGLDPIGQKHMLELLVSLKEQKLQHLLSNQVEIHNQ